MLPNQTKRLLGFMLILSFAQGQLVPPGYYSLRDSAWVHEMDSVFVTGLESARLSPSTRITVPQARIDAMAYRDLNEILINEIPGVFGTEKGVMGYGVASGSAGKLTLRGQGGDPTTGVLILQNGKPELMGLMGHPVPDAYAADPVAEVEVIKGAASILYGTNALGGAVNMKTRRIAKSGFETRLRAAAGSYGIQRGNLQHGGRMGSWDYFLTLGSRSTDGHRPHSAFDSQAYHLRVGYEFAPEAYISLVGKLVPFHMEDPGPAGGDIGLEYDITRSDLTLSTRFGFDRVQLDYMLYHNAGEHKISDGFHSQDYGNGLSLKHYLSILPQNTTTLGLDVKQYGGTLHGVFVPSLVGQSFEVTESAVYLLTEQSWWRTDLMGGLRYETHTEYGNIVVPYAGVRADLAPAIDVHASYSEGFRSPTIRELYLFPAPNPDLEPERSRTAEAGLSYQPDQLMHVDFTVYQSTGTNRIETAGIWPDLVLRNSGEFTYQGIDLALKLIPFQGLHLGLNGSWFESDQPIVNQPDIQISSTLGFHRPWYTVRGQVQHVHGVQYFEMGQYSKLPAYTIADLGIDYRPWPVVTLNLQIKNLLDAEYESMPGFPMPGRVMEGGLTLAF